MAEYRPFNLEDRTREVFDAHHRAQAANERIFRRLVSLVSEEYFGVDAGYFEGRSVADVGCGSNANASVAFLQLGAAHVHSVDLGVEWMDCATERLAPFGSRSTLGTEDVHRLTMATGSFDFVHCAGVLHHVRDPTTGFGELARVTRPGGYTYISVMGTCDGVIYRVINGLRDRYEADPSFRTAVDGLTIDHLRTAISWLLDSKERHEPSTQAERDVLLSLVDEDLVLTIKDRLQAPTYHGFAIVESLARSWFTAVGYQDVRRLTRYVYGLENVRRFLAPLYLEYTHPLARLLFGDGYVQLIGRQPTGDQTTPCTSAEQT
ncbi:methyltransferase family protein [Kribbella steppae]|uniref:Methyltransferase family protein n=1 Tax=Kribbella steppae TaxID=2512223 RepID=A0A4R2GWY9_9ACTN|nr:class I SAM-dependent methyltransferase [Kribbella steppae]TCO15701.1 methyltransferase family protein [Kribbella steppae]